MPRVLSRKQPVFGLTSLNRFDFRNSSHFSRELDTLTEVDREVPFWGANLLESVDILAWSNRLFPMGKVTGVMMIESVNLINY